MKIVFASHSYLSPIFVVGSQHLARAAAREHDVWHLSAAVSPVHLPAALLRRDVRERVGLTLRGGRAIEARLWESIPFTWLPWQVLRKLPVPERHYLLGGGQTVRRHARRLGFERPDLLLIDEPRMAPLIDLLEPRTTLYRPTDVYSELKGDRSLDDVERRLLARVQGVVATSEPVLQHVRALVGSELPALCLENGVDVPHFATPQPEPAELAGCRRPRAIYVGALDHRFDAGLLARAAQAHPTIQFIVIGGRLAGPLPANVRVLGERPYARIPAYLQHADFAIMPLSASPSNQGRSPMKLYEFGAAGLPVVASATAELERRALPFVSLARSPEELVALCGRMKPSAALRQAAEQSAALHSWQSKTAELLQFAHGVAPGSTAGQASRMFSMDPR